MALIGIRNRVQSQEEAGGGVTWVGTSWAPGVCRVQGEVEHVVDDRRRTHGIDWLASYHGR